jgi:hypothetical protein
MPVEAHDNASLVLHLNVTIMIIMEYPENKGDALSCVSTEKSYQIITIMKICVLFFAFLIVLLFRILRFFKIQHHSVYTIA